MEAEAEAVLKSTASTSLLSSQVNGVDNEDDSNDNDDDGDDNDL